MEKILYSKQSDYRDEHFNYLTEIIKIEDKKYVRKSPRTHESEENIKRLIDNYNRLKEIFEPGVEVCLVKEDKQSVLFDFIEGKSLEEQLGELFESKDEPKITQLLDEYHDIVFKMYTGKDYIANIEFDKVFGHQDFEEKMDIGNYVNIDLNFDNIVGEAKRTIIDYEWCFDFPVPLKYIFWKGLFNSNTFSQFEDLKKKEFYNRYEISDDLIEKFLDMEINFVKYAKGTKISFDDEHEKINAGLISLNDSEWDSKTYPLKIFSRNGENVQEIYKGVTHPGLNRFEFEVDEDAETIELFIAPVSSIITNIKLESAEKGEAKKIDYWTTSEADEMDTKFFLKNNPVILFKNESYRKIAVEFYVSVWNATMLSDDLIEQYFSSLNYASKSFMVNHERMIENHERMIENLRSQSFIEAFKYFISIRKESRRDKN